MPRQRHQTRIELVQGTLDMLILKTLQFGPQHGHGIGVAIRAGSGDALDVDHGSLYPALQRLEQREWIKGAWGTSDNNRRARFYSLTALGKRNLTIETSRWNRLVESIARVMEPGPTAENA
jgi:transcriptional regulator